MTSSTVAALTAAGALDGTELLYGVQSGNDRKLTTAQIRTLVVPAGGNKNYPLAKNSSSDNDFAYVSPLLLHPGYVSGRWYNNFPRQSTITNTTIAANTVYYTPLFVPVRTTFNSVVVHTGTANATATNALLGIYANSAGVPGAKTVTINAVATGITSAATNVTSITPDGGSFTLDAGFYWIAVVYDTAGAIHNGLAQDGIMQFFFGTTSVGSGYSASAVVGYTEASATLPSTATPVASITAAGLAAPYLKAA